MFPLHLKGPAQLLTLELINITEGNNRGSVSSHLSPAHFLQPSHCHVDGVKEIRDNDRQDGLRFVRQDKCKGSEGLKAVLFHFD